MSGETILCCIFQMHCKLKWIVKTRRSEVQLKFSYIKSPIIKKQLRECRFHRVEEQEERGNRILWARKRNCCLFTHNSLSVCVFLGDKKSLILWLLLDPFSLSSYLNIILKPNLRKKKKNITKQSTYWSNKWYNNINTEVLWCYCPHRW